MGILLDAVDPGPGREEEEEDGGGDDDELLFIVLLLLGGVVGILICLSLSLSLSLCVCVGVSGTLSVLDSLSVGVQWIYIRVVGEEAGRRSSVVLCRGADTHPFDNIQLLSRKFDGGLGGGDEGMD